MAKVKLIDALDKTFILESTCVSSIAKEGDYYSDPNNNYARDYVTTVVCDGYSYKICLPLGVVEDALYINPSHQVRAKDL